MANLLKVRVYPDSSPNLTILELAHELKIPLFNIKSFLETLYEYNFILSDTQRLEFLETANKETNRLILLVNNLIQIELQQNNSALGIIHSRFQLSTLLSQVVSSYSLTAKNKNIKISCCFEKSDYLVYGNSDLIIQVINNLLINSLKYTFPQKNIFVRTRIFRSVFSNLSVKKEKLNLTILDEGLGIPKMQVNYLGTNINCFNFRNSGTVVKGTGIGLIIVKRILSTHKSNVLFLSLLGKGSMVSFSLIFQLVKGLEPATY